jgi:uncharacterized protein (UPF0261 family)
MTKNPRIVVAGVLDSKGNEIRFLAERVRAAGGIPTIMELSLGKEVGWADIPMSELGRRTGKSKEELFAMVRAEALEFIAEGGKAVVADLLSEGRLDGIIAFGGSMGTSIATRIMRSLPIGLPKMMLSTSASGYVRPYVGTRDIAMLYPIAEVGLNKVTRKVLNNAAAAVVGMANPPPLDAAAEKPLIGCMMLGVTTPCVLRASENFIMRGYEVMVNHATGPGGRSMEELIEDGYIVGMLDINTHEISDHLFGGRCDAGPLRLTAAGRKGIPQVISVGGLDIINFGARDTLPKKYEEEQHSPGRGIYIHNPEVTAVGVSMEEIYQVGNYMTEKLNQAIGPTCLCIPLRGWGAADIAGPDRALGWAGPGPGPVWWADPEHPEWSLRNKPLIEALREKINREKSNLDVLLVNMHMNQPEFADILTELLAKMLAGKWTKGSHQDLPCIVQF